MIACVLAANMSTCSAFMVDTGALFTQNIYRRYIRAEAADVHYLWVGRTAGAVITMGAIGLSFAIPMVLDAILFAENLAASWACRSWRR
jgi:Na+/proline symporter